MAPRDDDREGSRTTRNLMHREVMPTATTTTAKPSPGESVRSNYVGLRYAIVAFAPVALATGLAGGLWRLGLDVPGGDRFALLHGPLMISGLFGTLIGLERAVALGKGWVYAAPALSALATAMLLGGAPPAAAASAYLAAAAVLACASAVIVRLQPALFTAALLIGALAWGVGNLLWTAGNEIPNLAGWWIAFLVLTIAGERLDLSRLMPARRGSEALFIASAGFVIIGAFEGITFSVGARLFGLGLLVCAIWLLRHDIARRNVRATAAPRFFAVCMLAGYGWLALAGAFMLFGSATEAMFGYDIALHAVLIGFVLSMVFGHALIILPAVTGLRLAYRPLLYGPLAVLHVSLAMRIGGDLLQDESLRRSSGLVTTAAILLFAAGIVACRVQRR